MARVSKTQLYGRVERKLWRNKMFRYELSDDARLLWLYLLTTFREARLPGLVEATVLSIMEDLDWQNRCDAGDELEGIVKGSKKTTDALAEIERREWVIYSKEDRLLLLHRAVKHNLPANEDVVAKWVKSLKEFPDSSTKRSWLKAASAALVLAFGKEDRRYKLLRQYLNATVQTPLGVQPSKNTGEIDLTSTPCTPKEQDDFFNCSSDGGHGVVPTITSTSTSTKHNHKHEEETDGVPTSAPRTLQKPKPARRKKVVIEKSTTPPEDFTKRQKAFFDALQKTEFYIRGKDAQTAFDAVKDPIRLARNLGDVDAFPLVDTGLINRLGAWSFENMAKSKVDIGRFILARARVCQERGGDKGSKGPQAVNTGGAKKRYGDLDSK